MIKKVIDTINKSENILILTHEKPDGDALGSMLGLAISLKKINKHVQTFCISEIPKIFKFLPEIDRVGKDFLLGDFDLIIILDCGDMKRTGFPLRIEELSKHKNKIINIDHHPKNDLHKIAHINYIDYHASSTAEIVYEIVRKLKITMDKNISLCLLCGLYTDTGSFMHSNTSPKTLQIASDLLRFGARFKKIVANVVNFHTVASLQLRGIAFSRIKINPKYKIAISALGENDLKKINASIEDVGGIVNAINTMPDIKVALFMYQQDANTIKASLRTEDNKINLSKLAQLFGGGGLKKASGFSIKGRIVIKNNSFEINYL
jgi:phosphoesterase RecJ-like protein